MGLVSRETGVKVAMEYRDPTNVLSNAFDVIMAAGLLLPAVQTGLDAGIAG